MVYKGIVCKEAEDSFYLIIIDEFAYRFVPIHDHKGNYSTLSYSEGVYCAAKFFDGTEMVSFDYALESFFNDIFIGIEDFGAIESPNENLFEMLKNDYDGAGALWEVLEKIFQEEEIKSKYEEFLKMDFYGRPSIEDSKNTEV